MQIDAKMLKCKKYKKTSPAPAFSTKKQKWRKIAKVQKFKNAKYANRCKKS